MRLFIAMFWALPLLGGCYTTAVETHDDKPARRSGERRQTQPRTSVDVADTARDDGTDEAAGGGDLRWILTGDVMNARDLGGTPAADDRPLAYRKLFRGPPLANLSAAGCDALAELGVRTVIDLRVDSERSSVPQSSCVSDLAEVVTTPLPVPYGVSGQDYIAILDTTKSMAEIFRQLGDDAAYPIYLHCTWGRDRTGVVAAAILSALGSPREAIMREYLLSRSSVGAYPGSLEAALDMIDTRGGIDAYLDELGVTEEQVSTLRAVVLGE